MNPANIDAAIEALRAVFRRDRGVHAAILFGSAARGTADEGSDIDVLVIAEPGREDTLRRRIFKVERAHGVVVAPYLVPERDLLRTDRQFLESVLRHGRPLVGEMPRLAVQDLALEPYRIVRLYTGHLAHSEKMRLYRRLDGYRTVRRRGKRRYERAVRGFLDEVGGWRVGRGAIVVPESAVPELERILEEHKAKRWMVPTWVPAA